MKRAMKSDLEAVFKKVNTSIVGRKSSAPQCHVPARLAEYEFPPPHVHCNTAKWSSEIKPLIKC